MRESVKAQVRGLITDHEDTSRRLSNAAERLGAHTIADHLDRLRSGGDIATVRLPTPAAALRSTRLRMYAHGGGDQCAAALAADGWRGFEKPMPDVFLGEVRASSGHVLDVGANTGFYALVAALGNPRVSVTAFEPVPYICDVLRGNLGLNAVTGRVALEQVAVGAEDGTATLYLPPVAGPGIIETSASLSPDFKDTIAEEAIVAKWSLDSWWRAAGRPTVGVLKVDVESRELDVLRGAAELIERDRPVVFYELLPQGDAAGLAQFAEQHRLTDVRLRPAEAVFGRPVEFDPNAWNHLFVPAEHLTQVRERLASVRIRAL